VALNADQLAEIWPALREAIAGGEDSCVTFEVAGEADKWVQFVGHSLNCAYPNTVPPDMSHLPAKLVAALGEVEIEGWEAGKYVTFAVKTPEADPLASLIDAIFVVFLGCKPGEYHLDVTHEEL